MVCADLPGSGRSDKPAPALDHSAHSKRTGARELVAMMRGSDTSSSRSRSTIVAPVRVPSRA
ncbi:MAG: hypothetical protein QOK30_1433, partial [Nocardioidaceae bacterium]|nr:hypothetical protein [Nocardioidaceae bacterium]